MTDNLAGLKLMIPPDALSLCLEALFETARKFHPQQSPTLVVTVTQKSEYLSLVIQDDGIHLPMSALVDVWEPYFQVENKFTGETQGMGLGLAMVSAIVLGVGGKRSLSNRADGLGVEVEICLPVADPTASGILEHAEFSPSVLPKT